MISHCLGYIWKLSDPCRIFAVFNRSTDHKPLIMKTPTTTRKSSKAAVSVKSNKVASPAKEAKPLPKDVYFRYRYRLAVKAGNLGSAKKFANLLAKMGAVLEVKSEKFLTLEGGEKYLASLVKPKADAPTKAPGKAVAKSNDLGLKETLAMIQQMAAEYGWDKAEVLKLTMAAINKVGA